MEKQQKKVSVCAGTVYEKEYEVTLTPIFTTQGNKSFKGIQVDMNLPDGSHFARERFASNVNPGVIQNWIIKMNMAEYQVQNTLEAFAEWDGVLNEYW